MNHERKTREFAMHRRVGGSPERAEALNRFNEAQEDWHGSCRQCGTRLRGTLAQIREHRCHGT